MLPSPILRVKTEKVKEEERQEDHHNDEDGSTRKRVVAAPVISASSDVQAIIKTENEMININNNNTNNNSHDWKNGNWCWLSPPPPPPPISKSSVDSLLPPFGSPTTNELFTGSPSSSLLVVPSPVMITPMKREIGFGNDNRGGNRNGSRMTIVPKPSSRRRDIFLNADTTATDTDVSSNICSTGIAPAVAVFADDGDGDGREWQNGNWCWLVPCPQSTRRRRNTGDTVDHRQKNAATQLYRRQQNDESDTVTPPLLSSTAVIVPHYTKSRKSYTPKRNPDDTNSNKNNLVGNKYDKIEDDDTDNETTDDADHDNDSDEDFVLVTTSKQKTNAVSRLERDKRAAAKKNQRIWKCYGHTRRPKQNVVHPSKKRLQLRRTQHEKEQRTARPPRHCLIADLDGFHPRATKRSASKPAEDTEEPVVVVQTDDKKNYPSVASFFSKIQR